MSPDIVICAIYSVVEQSKRNVSSCLTVFFFTPFPDIIDNSKIITDECRKKVNKKPTSIWFVVQTFVIIPSQECSFDCLDQIQMYFMKYIKHLMGFFPLQLYQLKETYYAIEIDPSLTIEEKFPYMVEW